MAHFALVQEGVVKYVTKIENEALDGGQFPASEPLGQAFLADHGIGGTWLQCSYSGAFRSAYPGEGWRYDAEADEFVPPAETVAV